jgi:hypothetical protein
MDYPEEIADLENREPVFVSTDSQNLRDFVNNLIEDVTNDKGLVVYIGSIKTSKKVKSMLEERDIDMNKILFFDMATKVTGSAPEDVKNTVFFDPEDINQVNMQLDDAVEAVPEDREAIIIFDTISTLSIYNDEEVIIEFLESLSDKMSGWDVSSVLIGVEAEMGEELTEAMEDSVETKYDLTGE